MKPTMTAVKAALHGKRVTRTVEGLATTDDIDTLRTQFKARLAQSNIPPEQFQEDDKKFFIKDGIQYVMKPKLKKQATGIIEFHSKDYTFTDDEPREHVGKVPSFGLLKGLIPMNGNTGFICEVPGTTGRIVYTLA